MILLRHRMAPIFTKPSPLPPCFAVTVIDIAGREILAAEASKDEKSMLCRKLRHDIPVVFAAPVCAFPVEKVKTF